MRIIVLAVGRLRPPFADDVQHYQKLLAGHARVEVVELRDEEKVVSRIPDRSYAVLLDEEEIPGVVVSRINLSPRFMRELIDAMEDNWSKWQAKEGIRSLPEYDGPPTDQTGGGSTGPSEES